MLKILEIHEQSYKKNTFGKVRNFWKKNQNFD